MKVAGGVVLAIALIALGVSVVMQRSASGELKRMRELTQLKVDSLSASKRSGWVEGTAGADTLSTAPVSGEKVAFWVTDSSRHWDERQEQCTTDSNGNRDCHDTWHARSEHLDTNFSTQPLLVRGRETSAVVAGTSDVAEELKVTDTRRENARGWGSFNTRDERIEIEEKVLRDGERILVMGNVDASTTPARFTKTDGVPLVVPGTFAERETHLAGRAGTAATVQKASIGGVIIGLVLLVLGFASGGRPFGGAGSGPEDESYSRM